MFPNPRTHIAGYAVLVFACLKVGLLLTNYNVPWVQPEEFNWREHILKDGASLSSRDVLNSLDWKTFEYEPRISRPLSHVFEIMDTKFRVWLWNFLVPHPSLSLTWFFLLGLSPVLFFKLLRNLDIEPSVAAMTTALYLATPGTLSLAAVDFRPAKPLANCAILACLYWASRIHKRDTGQPAVVGKLFGSFFVLCVFMFASFFVDETALLSFPTVLILFPKVVSRNRRRLACFCALPVLTYLAYWRWIPSVTAWAGFEPPRLLDYGPTASLSGSGAFRMLVTPEVLRDLPLNLSMFLSDTLGLVNPLLARSWHYRVLWIGVVVYVGLVVAGIARLLYRRGLTKDRTAVRSLVLLVAVTLFANIMLHLVENRLWGLHWLNAYWPIFFLIPVGLLTDKLRLNRVVAAVGTCLVIAASIYNFTYVNNAFKQFFYYRKVVFEDVLVHKINRFDVPLQGDSRLFTTTYSIWKQHENEAVISSIPTELYYLVHDLRLIAPGTTMTGRWSVFDGHVLEFDLVRSPDPTKKSFEVIPAKRVSN
jgi:hypothetical protein